MPFSRLPRWILLVLALALGAGVVQCALLMWGCDDAYITFRYAANLVEGHGLIFNPGAPSERVEGYSNFSWTLVMALGLWLGVDRDDLWLWAGWLGLVCHVATALVLVKASLRSFGARAVPVAAIALGVHHYWASLAVCGLETALFTLLVTVLATGAAAGSAGRRSMRACAALGVTAALCCWTRPDGALPSLSVGLWLVGEALVARRLGLAPRTAWLRVLVYGGAAALLLVPHLLWRHAYYGAWVPNTAVAKSASEPYLGRGLDYLGWYFRVYWIVGLGALGLVVGLVGRRSARPVPIADAGVERASSTPRRLAGVALSIAVPYLGFVLWVGGDFMFGRFVLPITPLLYLGFETAWPTVRGLRSDLLRVAVAVLGTAIVFPPAWLDDYKNERGFSDNRAISVAPLDPAHPEGPSRLGAYLAAGRMMRELTEGLDVRVALHGSHANLAYTGEFPVAIETAAGLTDAFIARLPVAHRGMVGHEKHFRQFRGYLEQRSVLVNFHLAWTGGNAIDRMKHAATGWPLRSIWFVHPRHPGVMLPATLVTYQKELLDEIARRSPECRFVRFDEWLDDEYLPTVERRAPDVVARHLEAMDLFYFDHNTDPERRRPIAARAAAAR